MPIVNEELQTHEARIELLVDEMESYPDQEVRAKLAEMVRELMDLYGQGLTRIVDIVTKQGEAGEETMDAFTQDELISHLFVLHDLHPIDVKERVERALEDVRPKLKSHGGNVELIAIENGTARLRLLGSCNGCPSSTQTLRTAVEEAIRKAAPELISIEAAEPEFRAEEPVRARVSFVPISTLVHSAG